MNRTLKEATVRRYHYESHNRLTSYLTAFVDAYNFARRLKTLKNLTPFEFITQRWTDQKDRFRHNPTHHFPGLNIQSRLRPIKFARSRRATRAWPGNADSILATA